MATKKGGGVKGPVKAGVGGKKGKKGRVKGPKSSGVGSGKRAAKKK